jgi:hypothetical protein
MSTRKMKILQRSDEDKENKRQRTPEQDVAHRNIAVAHRNTSEQDVAPSNTVPTYEPKTPENPPPPAPEDKEIQEAAQAIANLQHSPAWCDPIRPLDILGGQYPDAELYDFKITKAKNTNNNLQIYYVGICHGYGSRPFNFNVQSPACSVSFIPSKYDQTENRVFIAPKAPDGFFTAYPSEYLAFIDHIECVAMRLKREMTNLGCDTTHWKLPMKFNDGICQGIYAKVKRDSVREILKERSNHVRVSLKLACIFFGNNNSGLSFEIINAL